MGAMGAAAGALCGVVTSYLFLMTQARHAPPAPMVAASRPNSPQIIHIPVPGQPRETDLRPIEERLARLEDASRGTGPVGSGGLAPPEPPELAREQARESANQREASHNAEVRDPVWAQRANAEFSEDLSALGGANHLRVESVECRSRTCFAYVNWPSFREANQSRSDLLHHDYRQNCSRLVYLPPPEDPSAPYRARIDFDCAGIRSPEEPAPPRPQ